MDAEQAKALRAEFPPSSIGKLPKPYRADSPKGQCRECNGFHGMPAVHLDYAGHAAVTDRLLKVDPLWSWEPFATDERGLPALDSKGNLWIRLTVCGVTRIGVGDGKNAKEVIGDAIRNAAMRFGVALDLWAKEDLHAGDEERGRPPDPAPTPEGDAQPGAEPKPTRTLRRPSRSAATDAPEKITTDQIKKLHASFGDAGLTERDKRLEYASRIVGRELATSSDLTKAEASRVIEALVQDGQAEDDQWRAGQ